MSPVILLTGGRAPATLDLARRLNAGGARVHLAESLPWTVTHFSAAIAGRHRVRPPRQDPDGFIEDLRQWCAELGVDVLVPTCEEVFWVARDPELPALLESRSRLRRVHDKEAFVRWAAELGLAVPDTARAEDSEGLADAITALGGRDQVVLKPVFSRFATSARIRPPAADVASITPTAEHPWAVQRYLPGPVACSWGIAHAGRLAVHTAYRAQFTAGAGSAVHFAALADEQVEAWVERFAERTGWTGQLAFDFVLTEDGPVAIECNPRLTSGIHLLSDGEALLAALLGQGGPRVRPASDARAQIAAAMFLYGAPRAWRAGELGAWWRAATSSREVSWDRRDLAPFFLQGVSIARLLARAAAVGEGILDATTWDIRWDGEG